MERIRLKKKNPDVRIILSKSSSRRCRRKKKIGRRVKLGTDRLQLTSHRKRIDEGKRWSSSDRELDCGGC